MRSDEALRYLLLKHLWKLRASTEPGLHREIAHSLTVQQMAGLYVVCWTRGTGFNRIECPADRFVFYRRGDTARQDPGSHPMPDRDNEQAARQMAAEIAGVILPPKGTVGGTAWYGDVWRWPLLCAVGALACFATSGRLLPLVLAGIAVLEPRVRTYRLYFPFAAALVLGGYNISAGVMGIVLASATWLAGTGRGGRVDALVYLLLGSVGWRVMWEQPSAPLEWAYVLGALLIAVPVWMLLWLSFEGPRLSTLLAPIAAVAALIDGRTDVALTLLSVCVAYSAWLTISASPFRLRLGAAGRVGNRD